MRVNTILIHVIEISTHNIIFKCETIADDSENTTVLTIASPNKL